MLLKNFFIFLLAATAGYAQETLILPADTPVALQTVDDLTSKKAHKGDQVRLIVAEDLITNGKIMVAKGTPAFGRIAFAQDTGAFGQSGKLQIEPLYLTVNGTTVRLKGSVFKKGTVTAGAAAGLVVITPGLTGRTAKIPSGTPIPAAVLRDAMLKNNSSSAN